MKYFVDILFNANKKRCAMEELDFCSLYDLTYFPAPAKEKHAHGMILPSQCFTLGVQGDM